MQKTKFKIQGIKCANCSLLIEERLKTKEGIVKVKVDQASNKGVVIYDEEKISENDIYWFIEGMNDFHLERIGEETFLRQEEPGDNEDNGTSGTKKVKFRIKGLKCNNCVLLIEERLKTKEGIVKVKVDQASNKGVVIYNQQKINEKDIYSIIEEIGGFKVEKMENALEIVEEKTNYENPSESKDIKPPIDKTTQRLYAFIAGIAILIVFFSFGPNNNQNSQINGSVNNTAPSGQQQGNNTKQVPAVKKAVEKSNDPVLEAYIVSRCPYGIQMQRVFADVVKNIPSLASKMKVRYMGAIVNGKITAMHGDAEAQENLRQICIREEQPAKYWPYVSCQMKSPGTEKSCEKSVLVDSTKLSACISDSNKGLAYAKKDFDLSNTYQVQGSPTLILNGAQVSESSFGGRTSEAIKSMMCSGFITQPADCLAKLTETQASVNFSPTY